MADPGIGSAGVWRDFAEMDEGQHDAKHDQPAVENAANRENANRSNDRRRGDRDAERRRCAGNAHDGRLEGAE